MREKLQIVWTNIKEFFEKYSFMKWLAPLLALVILVASISLPVFFGGNSADGSFSSNQDTVGVSNISLQDLIEKNQPSIMLRDNKTLLVTSTEYDSRDNVQVKNVWYYNYEDGALWVDYRSKAGDGKTLESGSYYDGIYYGLEDEASFLQFIPQKDFTALVCEFIAVNFPETVVQDAFSVVEDDLILRADGMGADGNHYNWAYCFELNTLQLKKVMVLIYRTDGAFIKSQETIYKYGENVEYPRTAYHEITAPQNGEVVNVSAQYIENGNVAHTRQLKFSKSANLYAKDVLTNTDYCVYADSACTQVLCDLSDVAQDGKATIYICKAKEGDVALRDLKIAQRDNALANVMQEYDRYLAKYTLYTLSDEKQSQQYWYYDTHREDALGENGGTMTLDCQEKDSGNTTLKVMNFRNSAFYTWMLDDTSAGRREFAYVLDNDFENVLYEYGKTSMGVQKIKEAFAATEKANTYQLTTTRQEGLSDYKFSDWIYTFKKLNGKLMLQSIRIEYYSFTDECMAYADVEIIYNGQWTPSTEAYDRIAGNRAGTKITGNLQIDYQTEYHRVVPYSLSNATYISVYPSKVGVAYDMYRHDLLNTITHIGILSQALKKDVYIISRNGG